MTTEYDKIKKDIPNPVTEEEVQETSLEKRPLQKVVKKVPKQHKKGLMERLVIGMLGPDGLPAIGRRLGEDIIMPAVKNIIVDAFTSGINMAIFGNDEQRRNDSRSYNGPSTSYWNQSQRSNYAPRTNYQAGPSHAQQPAPRRTGRGRYVPDYPLPDRREAMDVLEGLRDQIQQYGNATIADYYDLIGIEPNHTDNDYGWDDLRHTRVISTSKGYIIQFPAVEVI